GCQTIPSLAKLRSEFSSQRGESSKSGCEVKARATIPSVSPNPTSEGFKEVGKTYPKTGAPLSCPAGVGVVFPAVPFTVISQIVAPISGECFTLTFLIW